MKDTNLELAELKEHLDEVRWQREKAYGDLELSRQTTDKVTAELKDALGRIKTLELALQACQQRIQMYDSVLASLQLTLRGLDSAITGKQ